MAGRDLFATQPQGGGGRDLFANPEAQARIGQRKAEESQRQAGREQTIQQTPSVSGRISEAFTGAQRQTPETQALPEFRQTEEIQGLAPRGLGKQLKLTAGLLSSFSPEAQMDVIRESIPDAQFSEDAQGNVIVDIEGKQSILNKPGLSGQDVVPLVANVLANMGPAKLAGLAKSTFARVIGQATAGAAVEQARQEVSKAAGSEQPREPGSTALAGAIGGLAETIGPAREAARGRIAKSRLGASGSKLSPDIPEAFENVAAAQEAVQGVEGFTGVRVPLAKPQQTLIPSELQLQRLLPQLDASSKTAADALLKQNRKVAEAVDVAIESITPKDVFGVPEKARTAAQRAIDFKREIRDEIASPFFENAKKEIIDVKDVVSFIDSEMKPFLGVSNVKSQLNKIRSNVVRATEEGAEGIQEASIGELQKAKAVIDDILSATGDTKVSGDSKRVVQRIKERLLLAMDGAGTATGEEAAQVRDKVKSLMSDIQAGKEVSIGEISQLPEYAQGRLLFAQTSPGIASLEEGITGKLAGLDNIQVETLANTVLDPKLRDKTIIDSFKVLNAVNPGIGNDLIKFKMLDNMTSILPPKAGTIENTAGKIRSKLFGNPKQRRALMAGMSPEQKKNFTFLDKMLSRAEAGRFEGSPTASFQEIIKNVKSVPLLLQRLFTLQASEIQKVGQQGLLNSRLKGLAKTVYDETWTQEMAKIRKLNPNTAAAGKAMAQLLKNIDINSEREQ